MNDAALAGSARAWFLCVLLYLVVDYARPQDLLPIGVLKPGLIVVALLAFFLLASGRLKSSDSRQTRLILLFVALTAAYVPFASNSFRAFQTTRTMFLYLPFILSVIVVVDSPARLRQLILFMTVIMVYVCLYSLRHGIMAGNYFKDENDLALYVNTLLPFSVAGLLGERRPLWRLTYAAALAIGLTTVVLSFSRGGFVGLLCMLAVGWLFSPRKVLSLVLVGALLGLVLLVGGESYKREMGTAADTQQATARERILSWEAAWRMFVHNPWGVGGNNFQVRFPDYQPAELPRGMYGRVAHSLWFTLLPELGVAGVLIYISLLSANLKAALFLARLPRGGPADLSYLQQLGRAFLASFGGYFGSATFLSVLYYPHYWYLIAALVAARRMGGAIAPPAPADQPVPGGS